MRKISSKYERKRKQRRNQWIVGGILIFLMFASTLGFAFQGNLGSGDTNSDENILNYNGLEFENINGFWVLGRFAFTYNPEEVPSVEGDQTLTDIESYEGGPLYIYSDIAQAESEIRVNLGQIASSVENACLDREGFECDSETQTKTCYDNFIIIQENNTNKISQEEGCVFIQGASQGNAVRNTDQFLFKILGIK